MSDNLKSQTQIADILGTNDMRIHRYIKRNKIHVKEKDGSQKFYNLSDFNKLKEQIKHEKATEKPKVSKGHTISKDEYIALLKETLNQERNSQKQNLEFLKKHYEAQLKDKDETISALKSDNNDLRAEVSDKKKEIANWTQQSASNALATQRLLAERPIHADTSNEKPDSDNKTDNSSKGNAEKPHQNWFQRHFGRK